MNPQKSECIILCILFKHAKAIKVDLFLTRKWKQNKKIRNTETKFANKETKTC